MRAEVIVLYLVRHGRTAANAAGLLQGRIDNPIDDVGRTQVGLLPGAIPSVDRLICSPLTRARQTAAAFGVEPEIDERWIELDFGPLDGTRVVDVPTVEWNRWMSEPDFAPAGCETLRSLANRVGEACDELLEQARDSNVVVVSHATPVKAAMAWALGADVTIVARSFIDQASITTVAVRGATPSLVGFNRIP